MNRYWAAVCAFVVVVAAGMAVALDDNTPAAIEPAAAVVTTPAPSPARAADGARVEVAPPKAESTADAASAGTDAAGAQVTQAHDAPSDATARPAPSVQPEPDVQPEPAVQPEPTAETVAAAHSAPAEGTDPPTPAAVTPADEVAPIADAAPPSHLQILALDSGAPIAGARVASVAGAARSDGEGLVALADLAGSGEGGPLAETGAERYPRYHVVVAGFWPRRAAAAVDGVITMRPLDVRAVYLPYEQLWNPESLEWALALAREGLISAIVIDIKEEGGGVLPLVATDAVLEIDAVVDPGADMAAFLDELAWMGVYLIARQVVFLDTRLGRADPATALLTPDGRQLRDDVGLGWTTPFSAKARRYNIDIALQAAPYFDEIQFDYIRFPAGPFQVHADTTGEERSAAVARFAQEASRALHAVGAAISVDTFGETTVIREEDAVGQVLEELIPYVDYYSPMLYPSTWAAGTFGLEYPPAHPGRIVEIAMRSAVERVRESGVAGVLVRPWLQDYRDYQPRRLHYGYRDVMAQIHASAAQGGAGFMLWNPALRYETGVLATLRDASAMTVSAGGP